MPHPRDVWTWALALHRLRPTRLDGPVRAVGRDPGSGKVPGHDFHAAGPAGDLVAASELVREDLIEAHLAEPASLSQHGPRGGTVAVGELNGQLPDAW